MVCLSQFEAKINNKKLNEDHEDQTDNNHLEIFGFCCDEILISDQ
jgi:hypothetical protein